MSRAIPRAAALSAAALVLLSLAGGPAAAGWFGNDEIEGSGVLVTKSLDLDGFDGIQIDGVFTVEVTVGDEFSVELEAEDNLIDLIETDIRRGTLILDFEDDWDIDTDESMTFTITMPELTEVIGNGVYEFYAEGLDNARTTVEAGGVGTIELAGKTEQLIVEAGGVGSVQLRDLVAQDARVEVSGVGDVEVYVENDLEATVDGLGSISYFGDPERIDDRVDGFGSIRAGR